MLKYLSSVILCALFLSIGNTACAAFITVDISGVANANYDSDYKIDRGDPIDPNWNPPPTSVLGGVDFDLPGQGLNNFYVFSGDNHSVPEVMSLDVSASNVFAAYLLLNTNWGPPPTDEFKAGSVTLETASESYTVDLIVGRNIRDWNNGQYANSTTDPNVTENVYSVDSDRWGKQGRMDMLKVILPMSFLGDTITRLSITDVGKNDESHIRFAGVTFDTVPEPTTLAIWGMLGGLGLIAARRRRKRSA